MAMYRVTLYLFLPILLGFGLVIGNQVYGQFGLSPLPSPAEVHPTYIVRIVPDASNQSSVMHYFPQKISIPAGTTITWFNDDPGQPHTVTSGDINATDSGKIFNSGIIPYSSFFLHTFTEAGNFVYHCDIHPWRTGVVQVSSSYEQGHHFKFTSGANLTQEAGQYAWTLNRAQNDRLLLNLKPTTASVTESTPITYNVTILDKNRSPVFSDQFFALGNDLQLELVLNDQTNKTSVYGPDFTDPITGAYHIEAPLPDGDYILRTEIIALGSKIPEQEIFDEFNGRIT